MIASTGYTTAFIGSFIFRLIAIVLVVTLVSGKRQSSTATATAIASFPYKALFTLPLVGAYLLAFGDFLFVGFDITLMPLWLHDHLGASVALIGVAYIAWSLPNMLLSPIGGRIADRVRRSWLIFIFGLAQVPLYITYGLMNVALVVVGLFALHGLVYAFIQPAVDAHVAKSSASNIRARVQGMYSTFGLIGAFVGASGFTQLYAINFRFPMFAIGIGYGICVLIGGTMIRLSERR